jgi:hypothetical protein
MSKIIEHWLLFKYVGVEFTPLSRPFKTREQAEKAREKSNHMLQFENVVGIVEWFRDAGEAHWQDLGKHRSFFS